MVSFFVLALLEISIEMSGFFNFISEEKTGSKNRVYDLISIKSEAYFFPFSFHFDSVPSKVIVSPSILIGTLLIPFFIRRTLELGIHFWRLSW